MLTRFVRIQLVIFTIASVIGMSVMAIRYMQVPTLLDLGRISVKLELPASGGLYRFSNVTYRGVRIGDVTALRATRTGAEATLSLNTSPEIPANLQAEVHSISAIGEQYVDLRPRTDSGPYLHDGSVIVASNATIPQPISPVLDRVSSLLNSIPQGKLSALLDESSKAFDGAGYDMGSLLDSSAQLAADTNGVAQRTRTLIEDSRPLLDAQAETNDSIRTWAHSLAGFTSQLARDDPQTRVLMQRGPDAANEASKLLTQLKATLPILLANLTSLGQVGVTYHPSIQQLLVLLPPYVASTQSYGMPTKNPVGEPLGEFATTIADPPACTTGFLPPSSWRSPADTSDADTPDGLYCKLPQDAPISVRGARNYPCMGVPGKRAPTVQLCNDPKGFLPITEHQHMFGPYPIDPNLLAQGIPPDDRVNRDSHTFGPLGGTPPPNVVPPPGPPPIGETPAPPAVDAPPPGEAPPVPLPNELSAAPSSFGSAGSGLSPSVAAAVYNPRTGQYATPDGHVFRQSDLVTPGVHLTWQDLLLR
jgi:phospholipid/cholesterol/gamma-HCH transport system substrate-binding protein